MLKRGRERRKWEDEERGKGRGREREGGDWWWLIVGGDEPTIYKGGVIGRMDKEKREVGRNRETIERRKGKNFKNSFNRKKKIKWVHCTCYAF